MSDTGKTKEYRIPERFADERELRIPRRSQSVPYNVKNLRRASALIDALPHGRVNGQPHQALDVLRHRKRIKGVSAS